MNRARHAAALALGGFLLGAACILFALDHFFPGDRSEFPFYVWLASLPVLPFVGYACSAFMQRHAMKIHGSGGGVQFLLGSAVTAMFSAGVAYFLWLALL